MVRIITNMRVIMQEMQKSDEENKKLKQLNIEYFLLIVNQLVIPRRMREGN